MKTIFHGFNRAFIVSGLGLGLAYTLLIQPASAASGQPVKLAWDANSESNLAGYNVYRSGQSGVFTSPPLNGVTPVLATSFSDSTVVAGQTYYYVVAAVSTQGLQGTHSSPIQAVAVPPPPVNQAPTVNAGIDQTITLPTASTLTAAITDDGLPYNTLTVQWSVVAGSGVTLTSPNSLSTSASFAAAGVFTLRLTVSDGQLTSSADLKVTVAAAPSGNQAPIVNAGLDRTVNLPNKLKLTATVKDDGLPYERLSVQWTLLSGPSVSMVNAKTVTTQVSFSTAGMYTLRVTVSDGVLTTVDDVTITVMKAPPTPLTVDDAQPSAFEDDLTIIVSRSNEILQDPNTPVIVRSYDLRADRIDLSIDERLEKTVLENALSYSWDTRLLSGNHTVSVIVYEGNNIISAKSVTINVR